MSSFGLGRLLPDLRLPGLREQARASVGALLGVLATALSMPLLAGAGPGVPLLIAPIGASAVLLFAVPSSPLAQPWSILGGNVSAALVAVACRTYIPDPALAAAVAVGAAIAVMFALRCLHPPGGAVALFTVLAPPAAQDLGYSFALVPVALSSFLLLLAAIAFNTLTGHRYPHMRKSEGRSARSPAAGARSLRFSPDDLETVLAGYDEVLPIDRDQLQELLIAAEAEACRRSAALTAAEIMRRDVPTVPAGASIARAWRALRTGGADAVVVLSDSGRVAGVADEADLLRAAGRAGPFKVAQVLGNRRNAARVVSAAATGRVTVVGAEAGLPEIVDLMASAGIRHLPVTTADGTLLGLVCQPDVLRLLAGGRGSAPTSRAAA